MVWWVVTHVAIHSGRKSKNKEKQASYITKKRETNKPTTNNEGKE